MYIYCVSQFSSKNEVDRYLFQIFIIKHVFVFSAGLKTPRGHRLCPVHSSDEIVTRAVFGRQ